jgi:hypothetical protein
VEEKEHFTPMVGMKLSAVTMEIGVEAPPKAKIELPYYPVIPLLNMYLKKCKSRYNKDTCTPKLIAALFTIDKL